MMTIFEREHRGYTCGMGTVMLEGNDFVKVVFVLGVVVPRLRDSEQQHGHWKKTVFSSPKPAYCALMVSARGVMRNL